MKLVIIYGPPGVGKLTVAKKLARITGYKIFHNHLTIDLVEAVFEWGTKVFDELVTKYRLEMIERAAKEKTKGMIFTIVYAKGEDEKYLHQIIGRVKKYHGQVYFVQLVCDKKELERRVRHPLRKSYQKIKTVKRLKQVMKRYEIFSAVPFGKNLTINNTKISPNKAALAIKEYFKL